MAKCTLLLTVILAFWIACSLASPRKHKKPKHGRHGKEGGYENDGDCKQTEHGKACTIPFKYKGVSYTECTRIDEPRPWCATSVKSNGEYRTYQYCSNQCALPVDGSLSPWSQWGICSASCGPGAQQRTRACDPAEHGGKPCDDERLQTRNCQVKPCPVDAKLGPWTPFSPCSAKCGPGIHYRTRSCTPPQFGGKACPRYVDIEKKTSLPGELEITPCEVKECQD